MTTAQRLFDYIRRTLGLYPDTAKLARKVGNITRELEQITQRNRELVLNNCKRVAQISEHNDALNLESKRAQRFAESLGAYLQVSR